MKKVYLLVLVCGGFYNLLLGQDFHYSQFYHSPHHLNPALTGIFNGDGRLMANYKSQWADVPVDYQTFTVAYDRKFYRRTDATGFLSGGLAINYDRAGDSRLTWGDINLNLSYTFGLSQMAFLTLGGQAAVVSRGFNQDNLRFDRQFDVPNGVFNEGLPNGETFANDSRIFPDFGGGINFRLQAKQTSTYVFRNNRRSKIDLGVGFYHLLRPDQSFIDGEKVPLPIRVSPYAMGVLQLGNNSPVDLVGNLTYQFQATYEELVALGGARIHLSNKLGKQFNILLGVGMRRNEIQDAWWPALELGINNIEIGINYDFNVSRFDIATENQGGLELSFRYLFRNVRPLPTFKSCPLI